MSVRSLQIASIDSGEEPGALLRAIVVCDLADSTAMIERLGDREAAALIRRHDQVARAAMQRNGGREIDKTDGFLILFDRPIDAVIFALDYQRQVRALAEETKHPLSARVGIHVGDVVVWDNVADDVARGAKPVDVEGLAKSIAARLMGLALPGQILVSGVAHALSRRAERDSDARLGTVRWVVHGQYRLKGVPEPIAVHEVGDVGIAPMRAPRSSPKARRGGAWWRDPILAACAGFAMLLAVSASLYLARYHEPKLGFSERDWLVIGDVVNVNADKTLDAAWAAAFRIGLEQSTFVNVLSDVQVRQALARMQRDRGTSIDREIGSEIALREKARAVILPSVVQTGSKLRFSAELIDPKSTHTVSIQSVDADDLKDALPAIDRLLSRVRTTLGESLNEIQASQPLATVTTANLDALRAFSGALSVARDGDTEQASRLLAYATELDPGFAYAYAMMGSLYFTQERYADARAALDKAVSISGRLSDRERLYIRAQVARFTDPRSMAEQWQLYASVYPDSGTGHNNVGNVRYIFLLDYAGAEKAFAAAAAPTTHNPWRNFTMHTLAHVLLAEEKVQEAETQFRAALALSPAPDLFGLSDALVARGKLDEAMEYLNTAPRQTAAQEIERRMRKTTVQIARGELNAAAATMKEIIVDASRLGTPNPAWRAAAAMVALQSAQNDTEGARELLAKHLAQLRSAALTPSTPSLETLDHLLYAATWAPRLGLVREAREALTLAQERGALDAFPVRARVATLVQAELHLAEGRPAAALELLSSSNDAELWEKHELRARTLRALGQSDREGEELRWLTSHRGLALAEWLDRFLGQQARALALRDAEGRLAHRS